MNTVLIIMFTIIIVVTILAMWYIITYFKLNHDAIRVNEADELIKEAIDERYELVISLKNLIKRNTKMDINIFTNLEKTKDTNTPLPDFERMITEAIGIIYQIENDYPKLETKKDFKNTINKLVESDTKIEALKNYYNTYNESIFNATKKLPNKLVAKIRKIEYKPAYDCKSLFNEDDDIIKI